MPPTGPRPCAGLAEIEDRARPHEQSLRLETGDSDKEDHETLGSCRRIARAHSRPVNFTAPWSALPPELRSHEKNIDFNSRTVKYLEQLSVILTHNNAAAPTRSSEMRDQYRGRDGSVDLCPFIFTPRSKYYPADFFTPTAPNFPKYLGAAIRNAVTANINYTKIILKFVESRNESLRYVVRHS